MGRSVVLLWVGAAGAQAEHTGALRSWAEARHVTVSAPAKAPSRPHFYPQERVERVEALVAEARASIDAADGDAAARKLTTAEMLLRRGPPPQAAWLMAEIYRLRAELPEQPEQRVAAWLERADALGGAQVPSYRDASFDRPPAPDDETARVRLRGVDDTDEVYVDGIRQDALEVSAGEHHVLVLRRGEIVYSAWVDAAPPDLTVATRRPPPCSDADLAGTRIAGDRVVTTPQITCPDWAVARPAGNGVEVARCHGAACGTLLYWAESDGAIFDEPAQPAWQDEPALPAWITWTLAGVATATVTGLVLWRAGTFDEPEPGRTRFVFTPPRRPAP